MNNHEQYPGRQWWERLEMWEDWLKGHIWYNVDGLEVEGIITRERLTYEAAIEQIKSSRKQMLPGMTWGNYWEYGWFKTQWTVPQQLEGKRLIFLAAVGEEMLVWVNGQERGAIDKKHKYITLTRQAHAGDTYQIVMECYAGHGPRMEAGCFCSRREDAFELQDGPQQSIGRSCIAVWDEVIFQTGMDYLTLFSLVKGLQDRSLRAVKVIEGLKRFTLKANLEETGERLHQALLEADEELKPLLECTNGSTTPEFTVFGQSHLDLAWLWTLEETRRKTARTYGNQLALMEEYPEYRFLLCEPPILEFMQESYPAVWERVRQKVEEGQIYADGALYVESDMNMPCGESLARQFLYGKEWFKRELGVDSQVAWMPDTFGYPASLPQIMKQCRVPYFTTQKLVRQDPECEPFPYNVFWWQGIDGSRVLSHLYKENNAIPLPEKMIERWEKDRIQTEEIDTMMYPFGYGDGGGGATRDELEMVRRCANLEGMPKTVYASPQSFFKKLEESNPTNVFTGDLYLAWHRGTYTSQAHTKLGVRRAECLLKEAEYWDTVCAVYAKSGVDGRREELQKLWKRLLLQEFHDILPGTGIARVHEEAVRELEAIAEEAKSILNDSLSLLEPDMVQPAMEKTESVMGYHEDTGRHYMESPFLYVELDHTGRIWQLRDKENGTEFVDISSPVNELRLYRNVNSYYDAWEIGRMYEQEEEELDRTNWKISKAEYDDRLAWLLQGRIRESSFSQYIVLSRDGRQLEFYTQIDWQECHKMLKVDFPSVIHSHEVIGEIAFGAYSQPTTQSWKWEKDRYEVCRHRYCALENGREGIAVFNDSKYGWSAKENQISLTLLRAPVMPDRDADRGVQQFAYACRPYVGTFQSEEIPKQAVGFDRQAHIPQEILAKEQKLAEKYGVCILEPYQQAESCHVMTEAVKLTEDGSGKAVIRLYEATGVPQKIWIRFPYEVEGLTETNMLEEEERKLQSTNGDYVLEFDAFEIKTLVVERRTCHAG